MKKILVFIALIGELVFLSACSFTTANFTNLQMASELDKQNNPVTITSTFTTSSPIIYATGIIKNAPQKTVIKSEWYYLETEDVTFIDEISYEVTEVTTVFYFSFSKPTSGWPLGNYEVKLYIDGVYKSTLSFKVE
jgi:hypothetical protein